MKAMIKLHATDNVAIAMRNLSAGEVITLDDLDLAILEDITKQKQLEHEQYQNSRIIAQQAKMAEMGEMIGAIAHQWRQPLNAINAAAIRLNFASTLDLLDIHEIQEKTKKQSLTKQSLHQSVLDIFAFVITFAAPFVFLAKSFQFF